MSTKCDFNLHSQLQLVILLLIIVYQQ